MAIEKRAAQNRIGGEQTSLRREKAPRRFTIVPGGPGSLVNGGNICISENGNQASCFLYVRRSKVRVLSENTCDRPGLFMNSPWE